MKDFSYKELELFLKYCSNLMPVTSFRNHGDYTGKKCILLRHDIDLDFFPAYEVAMMEAEIGVISTFFVLMTSPYYNPNSSEIRKLLREMADEYNFEIGLHFDPTAYGFQRPNIHILQSIIEKECAMLESITGKPVCSIAIHNPSKLVGYPIFKGYINAYESEFFEDKRYLSDSMRPNPKVSAFRGKNPYDFVTNANDFPLQIVLHPEQFFKEGGDYIDTMIRYNRNSMRNMLNDYTGCLL